MSRDIGIVGGGRFGRAIAQAARRNGHRVTLVSRVLAPDSIAHVQIARSASSLELAELVFVCVPSHATAAVADEIAEHLDGRHRLVHVSRGLVGDELRTLCDVLRTHTACRRVGVLAGPLVAEALESGAPGGAIVGSRFPEIAMLVRSAFRDDAVRVYETDDVVGVELASACVGVLSLALGLASALGLGPGALATIATRGVYETARLGETFGASRTTFGGLAGTGDLLAVVAGDQRPEFLVGQRVAAGARPEDAALDLGTHVESLTLVSRLVHHARQRDVPTPIFDAIEAVVSGRLAPPEAMRALMERKAGRET